MLQPTIFDRLITMLQNLQLRNQVNTLVPNVLDLPYFHVDLCYFLLVNTQFPVSKYTKQRKVKSSFLICMNCVQVSLKILIMYTVNVLKNFEHEIGLPNQPRKTAQTQIRLPLTNSTDPEEAV